MSQGNNLMRIVTAPTPISGPLIHLATASNSAATTTPPAINRAPTMLNTSRSRLRFMWVSVVAVRPRGMNRKDGRTNAMHPSCQIRIRLV